MSDAAIFVAVFGGFVVLRIIAATVVFFWLLPAGDRCPHCDAPTLRMQSKWCNRLLPWLRTSWCMECHWEGMLRHGPLTPAPGPTAAPSTTVAPITRRTRRPTSG